MEHTVEINVLKNISLENEPSISKKIVYAVNIHRDAIKLVFLTKIIKKYLYHLF